jgi:N-methylhydantoinase B
MTAATTKSEADGGLDPITIEVLRHGVIAIADQVEANVTRMAFSHHITEYRDYSVGFIGANGDLIAQCRKGIPTFVADSISRAVIDGLDIYGRERLHHGDFVLCNHPAVQGQHLNNTVMYTPIYAGPARDQLIGFFGINMHYLDVGGMAVGAGTFNSTDIFMEGLQLRTVKAWSGGEPVEEVLRIIEANTRFPRELMGDIRAQHMGCSMGRDLIAALADRYSIPVFLRVMNTILDQCEAATRAQIRAIPDGVYAADSFLDDDGVHPEPVPIKLKVIVDGDTMTVDFSDMPAELPTGFNSGWYGGGRTVARLAFKYLIATDVPANEGTYRPLKLILPSGKVISASPTAPMSIYVAPLPTTIDTIIKALAQALPDRVTGGHFGSHTSVRFFGRRANGAHFDCHDSGIGGHGASATHDGGGPFRTLSHGDNRLVPIELNERTYPFYVEEFRLRQDSAGAGRWRGGLGTVKQYRVTGPCKLHLNIDRTRCQPWGVHGGAPAWHGRALVYRRGRSEPEIFYRAEEIALEAGDVVRVETGGGGGYGPAVERPVALVQRDVQRGYISPAVAERDYGVTITADGTIRR